MYQRITISTIWILIEHRILFIVFLCSDALLSTSSYVLLSLSLSLSLANITICFSPPFLSIHTYILNPPRCVLNLFLPSMCFKRISREKETNPDDNNTLFYLLAKLLFQKGIVDRTKRTYMYIHRYINNIIYICIHIHI